jgi:hypothetical protein
MASVATDAEVLHFVDHHALFGRGVSHVDAHLLAAARLTPGTSLWTEDKRLRAIALQLGLADAGTDGSAPVAAVGSNANRMVQRETK